MNKIILASLFLVSVSFAETKIYKKVDKDGNITYTDQKPSKDAKEAELPGLTIVESNKNEYRPLQKDRQSDQKEDTNKNLFSNFRVTQPAFEQTINNTAGKLDVAVGMNGQLPKNIGIKFFVDSTAFDLVNSTSTTLNNIIRGEHTVYAQAIDKRTNRILKTTPKVKFFMRQHIKKR